MKAPNGTIGLGLGSADKQALVRDRSASGVGKIVSFSPSRFVVPFEGGETVEWSEIIEYRTYYRLLQEVGPTTLVVVNECLRTQVRHDLAYNCMRHILAQAGQVVVFQAFPLIDTLEDFMILFDFATRDRWRRESFRADLLGEVEFVGDRKRYSITPVRVKVDKATQARYAKRKRELVDGIGLRDPHTIPRTLHLLSGKAKAARVDPGQAYVARNQRLNLANVTSIKAVDGPTDATLIDFPHRFIDFADFLTVSGQTEIKALVSDLKVDEWYLQRFQAWAERVNDAQATLLR
jgi:hypothetical protein